MNKLNADKIKAAFSYATGIFNLVCYLTFVVFLILKLTIASYFPKPEPVRLRRRGFRKNAFKERQKELESKLSDVNR